MLSRVSHTWAGSYRGLDLKQHRDVYDVFRVFIEEVRPKRILEMGTHKGGLTLYLRDLLDSLGLADTEIKTFDIASYPEHEMLKASNIDVVIEDIFEQIDVSPKIMYTDCQGVQRTCTFTLDKPEMIDDFIKSPGLTVVLCDGGWKIGEFRTISPLLKDDDIIMCHDYVDTIENWEQNFKDKVWNAHEVEEADIKEICSEHGLVPYMLEEYAKVVWACRKKKA